MKSKYFKIHEIVPKNIYDKYGEKAWRFVPARLIRMIDSFKETFPDGTITINNYIWGGNRYWSGWRTPESTYYSTTSMHASCRAVDMLFSDYTADEVRKRVIAEQNGAFREVKGLELGTSWVHADVRNEDTLVTFNA